MPIPNTLYPLTQDATLSLSPTTELDLPDLVRTQYAAFHPIEPLHMLIYPSPNPPTEDIIQKTVTRQLKSIQEDEKVTWITITDDGDDASESKIVAGSKWCIFPPGEKEEGEERWKEKIDVYWVPESISLATEQGLCGKGVGDRTYVEWVIEKVFAKRRKYMQGPGVLLDLLFTHPEAQGRGAGKLMVNWGCKKADELGVRAWVEASYKGVRLYESCGFRRVEEVLIEGGKVKEEWRRYGAVGYLFMIREGKALKDLERES